LEHLREGDVLVVWKLDRLSRPLKDLLHIMERVRDAGARLSEPYGGRGYHNLRRTDGYADARQLCRIRALNGP
jgi:hypothetical protein